MKTSTKWLLVGLGVLVLCLFVLGVSVFLIHGNGMTSVAYGTRVGRLWGSGSSISVRAPINPIIKKAYFVRSPLIGLYSIFPFGILTMLLLCLCILPVFILIVLLVIVFSQKGSSKSTSTKVSSTPASEQVIDAQLSSPTAKTCAHCGQPIEDEWVVCPYCGSPLSEDAAQEE